MTKPRNTLLWYADKYLPPRKPKPAHLLHILTHSFIPFLLSCLSNAHLHQLSPHGCSAFIYNNGVDSYRYICWDSDAQIFPDYDGYYRITLYTGFPIDSKPEYAHPQYKHDYAWKEYRKVYTNAQGCLRPCEIFFKFFAVPPDLPLSIFELSVTTPISDMFTKKSMFYHR